MHPTGCIDVLVWLVVGVVTGAVADALAPRRRRPGGGAPIFGDLTMGVAGAALGGWLYQELAPRSGLTGAVALALFGAIVCLSLLRLLLSIRH